MKQQPSLDEELQNVKRGEVLAREIISTGSWEEAREKIVEFKDVLRNIFNNDWVYDLSVSKEDRFRIMNAGFLCGSTLFMHMGYGILDGSSDDFLKHFPEGTPTRAALEKDMDFSFVRVDLERRVEDMNTLEREFSIKTHGAWLVERFILSGYGCLTGDLNARLFIDTYGEVGHDFLKRHKVLANDIVEKGRRFYELSKKEEGSIRTEYHHAWDQECAWAFRGSEEYVAAEMALLDGLVEAEMVMWKEYGIPSFQVVRE
jgi:hypothetical protein